MTRIWNFSAGPAVLPAEVLEQVAAFVNGVVNIKILDGAGRSGNQAT